MRFREDINGLRAIAVTAVVLFHFGIPGLDGGFAGVDVFFVISGYLMTVIILSRFGRDAFSLTGFYRARARRILPALTATCVAVPVVGWFMLLPEEYETLGTHVLGSLTFLSNFVYWKEAGYFDAASHDKWLLHTWSLSVEWQFYLLYPLGLLALRRLFHPAALRGWVVVAAALSFACSVYASSRWETSAFFLLPTRAWELLAGGLVFLFPLQVSMRSARLLQYAGLALIGGSILAIGPDVHWPGWPATLPVLGTVLVILASRQDSALLGNRAMQFLGTTSYSTYLWHWPLAAWLAYFGLGREPLWVATGIVGAVTLGYLSYRLIESRRWQPARSPTRWAAASFVLAGALAATILLADGFQNRFSERLTTASQRLVLPSLSNGWCFYDIETFDSLPVGRRGLRCRLGDTASPRRMLLFGDSFAGHYEPFWDAIGKAWSLNISSITTNWCYPSLGDGWTGKPGRSRQQCQLNREYFRQHVDNYDYVVLSGSWGKIHAAGQLDDVVEAAEKAARHVELVVLMAAPPTFDVNVKNMYLRSLLHDLEFDISRYGKTRDADSRQANQRLEAFAEQREKVVFIDRDAMLHVDGKRSDVTAENVPFNLDEHGHLSLYGSQKAYEAFRESAAYDRLRQRLAQDHRPPDSDGAIVGDTDLASDGRPAL